MSARGHLDELNERLELLNIIFDNMNKSSDSIIFLPELFNDSPRDDIDALYRSGVSITEPFLQHKILSLDNFPLHFLTKEHNLKIKTKTKNEPYIFNIKLSNKIMLSPGDNIPKDINFQTYKEMLVFNKYASSLSIFNGGNRPSIDFLEPLINNLENFSVIEKYYLIKKKKININLNFFMSLGLEIKNINILVLIPPSIPSINQSIFYISGTQIEEAIFNTRMEIYNLTHKGVKLEHLHREIEELKMNLSRVEGMVTTSRFNNTRNNRDSSISRAHAARFRNNSKHKTRGKPPSLGIYRAMYRSRANSPRPSSRASKPLQVNNL